MTKIIKDKSRELILCGLILIICIIAALASPRFLTWNNITNLLRSSAVNGIMAMGMMLVIITGNIDMSIGSSIVVCGGLSAVVVGQRLPEDVNAFWGIVLCFLFSALIGIAVGALNGYFVAYMNISSIVVTLATMSILRGIICIATKGQWVTNLPTWFRTMANINVGGIYISVFIWIIVAVFTWILLNRMNLGRKLLATGGNPDGAKRVGIKTQRMVLFAFVFIGFTVSLAGVLFVSQNGMLDPMVGAGYELDLIAAVVIGGASLNGGSASTVGTVLGCFLLSLIQNALVLSGVPVYWQQFVTGVLILMTVVLSVLENGQRKSEE